MKSLSRVMLLSTLALSVNQAFAQAPNDKPGNEPEADETIVVTATRYRQDVDKIPGAVTVISEDDIMKQIRVSDDLTSVLANLVPSMTPSRQKLSNQGENLRGRTALILVDGVPQNNPLRNGNRYGHPIDSSMLERVEVVNGASAVHGMGATGGIINYLTLSAKAGDEFKQKAGVRLSDSGDSDATSTKAWYNLRHFEQQYDLVFASSWQDQGLYYDGNGEPIGMNSIQGETQDSSSRNFFIKTGVNFGDQRLEFSGNYYELESNNDYIPVKGDFANGIVGTVERGSSAGAPVSNQVESYNLTYSHDDLAGGGLTLQLFYQDFEAVYGQATWYPSADLAKDQGEIVSTKKGIKLAYSQSELFSFDDSWVFGLDILDDSTQQVLIDSGLGVTPQMSYLGLAPFVQGDILISDNIRLSAGLRYERTDVDVSDHQTLYSFGLTDEHGVAYGEVDLIGGSQEFSELVYNLGIVYSVSDEFNLYAGFNQGFGLPDIGRVLRGNWVGSNGQPTEDGPVLDFNTMPAVKPVVTDNYELGFNYTDEQWQLSATSYYSLAKDGANLSLNTGGSYDVVRQRTEITGAEFTAKYQVTENLALQALYARIKGEVDSDDNGSVDSDMDLKNLSPDRLLLAADYRVSDQLSTRIQVNTLMDADNKAENQTFDGYSLVDASMSYDFHSLGRLSFAVENLMDKYYVGYFSQIRNHSSYYFSGKGRTFSLGYELDF